MRYTIYDQYQDYLHVETELEAKELCEAGGKGTFYRPEGSPVPMMIFGGCLRGKSVHPASEEPEGGDKYPEWYTGDRKPTHGTTWR